MTSLTLKVNSHTALLILWPVYQMVSDHNIIQFMIDYLHRCLI